jgi:hypothetical protein
MRVYSHLKLLLFVSIAWIIFWLLGLPDYYQQYSFRFMLIFDLAILPIIWFVIYRSIKNAKSGRKLLRSIWWSFYITVPLFIYDIIYIGIYLEQGISFLWKYWYLTVYYIIPWIIFPPTGCLLERKQVKK